MSPLGAVGGVVYADEGRAGAVVFANSAGTRWISSAAWKGALVRGEQRVEGMGCASNKVLEFARGSDRVLRARAPCG